MIRRSTVRRYEVALLAVLLCFLVFYLIKTLHWPLIGDAPLMHYVIFLKDHGMVPYRDIVDINMPGTYAIQGAVIHLFGGGALTWRIFDYTLCGLLVIAMVVITWTHDPYAGALAGIIFTLLHGHDGPVEQGQRDLLITVLLLAGYATFFVALRQPARNLRTVLLPCVCACSLGIASTVKPDAFLYFPIFLIVLMKMSCQRKIPYFKLSIVLTGIFFLPWTLCLLQLHQEHALPAFFAVVRTLIPLHSTMGRQRIGYLLEHCIPSALFPLVVLWLPLCTSMRSWLHWERWSLSLGMLVGVVSFVAQGKGLTYHRYPFDALLLVIMFQGIAATLIAQRRYVTIYAVIVLAYSCLLLGPRLAQHAVHLEASAPPFAPMLQGDLRHLGGKGLSGKVQCFDIAAGCLDTLYQMDLVQASGFLYDCYLTMPGRFDVNDYRQRFLKILIQQQPEVLIVTSHQCGLSSMNYQYKELDQWDELSQLIRRRYRIYRDYIPPESVGSSAPTELSFGYRIYLRRSE